MHTFLRHPSTAPSSVNITTHKDIETGTGFLAQKQLFWGTGTTKMEYQLCRISNVCYQWHLVKEQLATRKTPHDHTPIHGKHLYDTDKYRSYQSQQASVATDETLMHNNHLYQPDKPQPECTQHLYSANIYARQTGIGLNKTQLQTFRQLLVATDNKNMSLKWFTANMINMWHWYCRYWLIAKECQW